MCTVHRDVYCSRRCVLFTEMCTVQGDVYCSQRCVLFTEMYIVHRDVYCSGRHILFTEMYTVHGDVYCSLRCVLFTEMYTVQDHGGIYSSGPAAGRGYGPHVYLGTEYIYILFKTRTGTCRVRSHTRGSTQWWPWDPSEGDGDHAGG